METKSAQPNEKDPGGDGEHADGGAQRHVLTQCNSAENEHHDRGRPASDRIDDADLATHVRPRKQYEIDELERGRGGDEGNGLRRNAAGQERRQRQQRNAPHEHPRRRRLHIPRPGKQHIPARVKERGAQRQGNGTAAQECSGSFIDSVSGASM